MCLAFALTNSLDLIVTCFSQRWDQQNQDHLNVVNGIIEETNAKTRPPITSVYDLAMLITSRCSGVFDRHSFCHPEYQFLDMFDSSIGAAMNCETELFDHFNRAVSRISPQLQRFVRQNARGEMDEASRRSVNTLSPDALLDIGCETSLLVEIKDIRDELNIIAVILDLQYQMADQLEALVVEELQAGNDRRAVDRLILEIRKRARELTRLLDMYGRDVERMNRQAEIIYTNLTHLLDLKQKHSNALEARFARDQAVQAGKQGQTIMIFTIVTVVFLPMSFISSFFAIEFADWGGGSTLTMGYVSKFMFGIGLGISIPLIAMALFVKDLTRAVKRAYGALRGGRERRRSVGEGAPAQGPKLEAFPTVAREMGLEPKIAFSGSEVAGSRARSGSYARDFESHMASRLSPAFGRLTGSRVSASSGGYERRLMRYSMDLESGRPGSGPVY